MTLLSKNFHNDASVIKLEINSLLGVDQTRVKNVKKIAIVSAYYSVKFLKKLFDNIDAANKEECQVICVFNGFSGQRLSDQINELASFKKHLYKRGFSEDHVAIYLDKNFDIFHTKIYYFSGDELTSYSVGSANATNQAFEKGGNEEILYRWVSKTSDKTAARTGIVDYVNSVIKRNNSLFFEIDEYDENYADKNLISFFRSANIYFKPAQQLQYTFNDVQLSEETEKKLSNISTYPRFTDPGRAWGALNLLLMIGQNIDVDMADELPSEARVSIKPWAIETCYGFWVPTTYSGNVLERLEDIEFRREKKYLAIRDAFNNANKSDQLNKKFEEYVLQVNEVLGHVAADEVINDKMKGDYLEKFKLFVSRFDAKINDDKFIRRLSRPLVPSIVPEFWTDEQAVAEFKESFFNYVSFYASSGRKPKIVARIFKFLSTNYPGDKFISRDDIQHDSIQKKFEAAIRKSGWKVDYWS